MKDLQFRLPETPLTSTPGSWIYDLGHVAGVKILQCRCAFVGVVGRRPRLDAVGLKNVDVRRVEGFLSRCIFKPFRYLPPHCREGPTSHVKRLAKLSARRRLTPPACWPCSRMQRRLALPRAMGLYGKGGGGFLLRGFYSI